MTLLDRCCSSAIYFFFFFSSRRRHTRLQGDWSSDVCSSDLLEVDDAQPADPEGGRPAHDEALVVGAAVRDAIGHALEDGLLGPAVRPRQHEADDPAHGRYSTPCMPSVSRT